MIAGKSCPTKEVELETIPKEKAIIGMTFNQ